MFAGGIEIIKLLLCYRYQLWCFDMIMNIIDIIIIDGMIIIWYTAACMNANNSMQYHTCYKSMFRMKVL